MKKINNKSKYKLNCVNNYQLKIYLYKINYNKIKKNINFNKSLYIYI